MMQEGKLLPMTQGELLRVADRYGTPTFLFDVGAFQDRLRAVHGIFGDDVKLCYAIKANPFLIGAAADVVERLEACSPGELAICNSLGIDAGQIVFSGVNKTAESVAEAVECGVGVLTAESLKHVRLIEAEGKRRGKVLDVLLRLNAGSQFGMSRDDLFSTVEHRSELEHVNIVGIHYFVGTQRMKLKHQRKELDMLIALFDELRDRFAFEVERLEYGPGLGVPLFAGDDFSDTLAPARELAESLRDVAARVELTVEMGRFFATECGTYFTSVNDVKENDGTRYCIVDGGINHLTYFGQLMGMKSPIIANLSAEARAAGAPGEGDGDASGGTCGEASASTWCICGSLCTTGDVLTRVAELADVREGDVLAFSHCGAYTVTEGVYLFLSRTMPRIVMRLPDGSYALARDFVETSPVNTAENERA